MPARIPKIIEFNCFFRSASKGLGESVESGDCAIPEIRISVAAGPGEPTVEYQYNSQSPHEASIVDANSPKITP